jgi:putative redox protein
LGGACFEHRVDGGGAYLTDAPQEAAPDAPLRGPKPMELLLGAAAGCTGVDLVQILGKMRLTPTRLEITVDGARADEHPRVFREVRISYEIETTPVDRRKVERAVALSATKYCAASATLASAGRVTYRLCYDGIESEGVIDGVDGG